MLGKYFEMNESIYAKQGEDLRQIITTIANRYIGQNPPHPLTYRAFCKKGIKRISDYRYQFDLDRIFPGTVPEMMVYAWSKLWSDQEGDLNLAVSGYGPVTLFLNQQAVFKSNILNERFPDYKSDIRVRLNKGWNHFIIKFIKTPAGFGGLVGTGSPKSFPLHFLMPSPEREGEEGWLFSPPCAEEWSEFPKEGISEAAFKFKWFPEREWTEPELKKSQLQRIFGLQENCTAIGWTKAFFNFLGINQYTLKGWNTGPIHIYLNEREVYSSQLSGKFLKNIEVPFGNHDLLVKSRCKGSDWGFQIDFINCAEEIIQFTSPYPLKGLARDWFYLGPFDEVNLPQLNELKRMNQLYRGIHGLCYWRLDLPDVWIRPYLENQLFGRWNYPLGVTLYGLIQTGRLLNDGGIIEYVKQHVEISTTHFQYAFWDKEQYDAAGLLHLLTNIDSLDDCGSFGSLMLELTKSVEVKNLREVADFIADYIHQQQVRLADGALFRKNGYHAFMDDTLWADDLYMSVPFLCRYYQLTGEQRYIDDAVKQIILYYQYLYLPQAKVMSHVFDVKIGKATGIAWGRGNGWVAFSCSELLEYLPEDHPERARLIGIFNNLCSGWLALQDDGGLWHQVLTDPESYPEASCTSMFIYAFARGVRYGWFDEDHKYLQAAIKGWNGLARDTIDNQGNIYGVCRGSGFSFTADYYKNDLSWILNDTHGIGIVMLAGVELFKMLQVIHQESGGHHCQDGTKPE